MVSMTTSLIYGFHSNGPYLWFPWQQTLSMGTMAEGFYIKTHLHSLGHRTMDFDNFFEQ